MAKRSHSFTYCIYFLLQRQKLSVTTGDVDTEMGTDIDNKHGHRYFIIFKIEKRILLVFLIGAAFFALICL
jgi:hypothetical protein